MREKLCVVCGKPITGRTGNNVKYCSEHCSRIAQGRKNVKHISKRTAALASIRVLVQSAYNYKCAICGWQNTSDEMLNGRGNLSHGCEIHHIVPASKGGTEEWTNLILLCPNHHKQANLGLISESELRALTRPYEKTEKEKLQAALKNRCAETVWNAIMATGNESKKE